MTIRPMRLAVLSSFPKTKTCVASPPGTLAVLAGVQYLIASDRVRAGHSPSQQMCSLHMLGCGKHSTSVARTFGFLLRRRSQDYLSKRQVLTLPSFNYDAMIANKNMLQTSIRKAVHIQVLQLLRTIAVGGFMFLCFSWVFGTTFRLSSFNRASSESIG